MTSTIMLPPRTGRFGWRPEPPAGRGDSASTGIVEARKRSVTLGGPKTTYGLKVLKGPLNRPSRPADPSPVSRERLSPERLHVLAGNLSSTTVADVLRQVAAVGGDGCLHLAGE